LKRKRRSNFKVLIIFEFAISLEITILICVKKEENLKNKFKSVISYLMETTNEEGKQDLDVLVDNIQDDRLFQLEEDGKKKTDKIGLVK